MCKLTLHASLAPHSHCSHVHPGLLCVSISYSLSTVWLHMQTTHDKYTRQPTNKHNQRNLKQRNRSRWPNIIIISIRRRKSRAWCFQMSSNVFLFQLLSSLSSITSLYLDGTFIICFLSLSSINNKMLLFTI